MSVFNELVGQDDVIARLLERAPSFAGSDDPRLGSHRPPGLRSFQCGASFRRGADLRR